MKMVTSEEEGEDRGRDRRLEMSPLDESNPL